jgi:DNA-directed RNA polymerase specialized sigma24 family protein
MTKQEFKNLVLPSRDKFFRVAVTLLGNRHEAEDTLQDVPEVVEYAEPVIRI